MPIIMAQNNRRFKACVGSELVDKSRYFAAKSLCLHVPESIGLTHAGVNDGKAYELLCHDQKVKQ